MPDLAPDLASPTWIPPHPWVELDPGVWTVLLPNHKLVITDTGWCVGSHEDPPDVGPANSLAAAALIACWSVFTDPSEWPLWPDGPAGLSAPLDVDTNQDLEDLACELAEASRHAEACRFWREQAQAHADVADRSEALAGGVGDGIASSAPAHRAAAARCIEAAGARYDRVVDATKRAKRLAEALGADLAALWPAPPTEPAAGDGSVTVLYHRDEDEPFAAVVVLDDHRLTRIQRLKQACAQAVPGTWEIVVEHVELVLDESRPGTNAIEVERVDDNAVVHVHVEVGLDELARSLRSLSAAVGR